jgi:predicted ester cyclase
MTRHATAGTSDAVNGTLGLSRDEMAGVPRRMSREVITEGRLEVADDLLDADFVDHNALAGTSPGAQGFKETVQLLRTGFPDLTVTPQRYIVEGDMVVEHAESTGTHDGPFYGLPPTHAPIAISAIVMLRLTPEGKIAERWGVFNLLELMQQLGIVPGGSSPRQAGTPVGSETDETPASAAESRAVFARYVDGVWGQADESVAVDVIDPQAVTPYNPQLPVGPAGTMAWVGLMRSAFPDLKVTLESVVGDEGFVCGRMLLQGTHEGAFLGVPPAGRSVSFEQMVLAKMSGGRIVTTWFETDLAGAMQQLGVMPG